MYERLAKKTTCNIDLNEGTKGVKLADYLKKTKNAPIVPAGFIFTEKGQYGKSVGIVLDEDTLVWLPKHCVETFEGLNDEEVEGVLNGRMRLENFKKYTNKNGTTIVFDIVENK